MRIQHIKIIFLAFVLCSCSSLPDVSSKNKATSVATPISTLYLDKPVVQFTEEKVTPMPDQEWWIEYENALAVRLLPGSKGLCEWEILGENEQEIYVWAMCQVPYSAEGAATSAPAVISFDTDGNIEKVEIPRDGNQYPTDIRKLFPTELHEKILSHSIDTEKMWDHIQLRHNSSEPPLIVIEGTMLP